MLKVLTFVSLLLVTGCATVSMVSREAIVENETSVEQSELRQSADDFKARAENAGWVSESRGLMDFANILFGGSEQTDRAPANYAEQIDAANAAPSTVFTQIAEDAMSATSDLAAIDTLASDLLSEGEVSRADVISFETALVTAQKSYRSFAEAAGIAGARGNDGLPQAEAALATLAASIDSARASADQLASSYAAATPADAITGT